MSEGKESLQSYQQVNDRLKEISEEITDDMPLDQALDLLEEAVGLGVKASSLIEADIEEQTSADQTPQEQASTDRTSVDESPIGQTSAEHAPVEQQVPEHQKSSDDLHQESSENLR